MKPIYIFPAIMIAMDIGAAVMCLIGKDYKKSGLLVRGGGAQCCSYVLKGA